jgi:hypothetical protein
MAGTEARRVVRVAERMIPVASDLLDLVVAEAEADGVEAARNHPRGYGARLAEAREEEPADLAGQARAARRASAR